MLPVFSSRCESVLGRAHRLDLWWPYSWSGQNEIHWVSGKDRRWRRPRGWPHRQAGQRLLLQIWPKNKSMRTEDRGNEMKLAKVRLPGTFLEKKDSPRKSLFQAQLSFFVFELQVSFRSLIQARNWEQAFKISYGIPGNTWWAKNQDNWISWMRSLLLSIPSLDTHLGFLGTDTRTLSNQGVLNDSEIAKTMPELLQPAVWWWLSQQHYAANHFRVDCFLLKISQDF